MEAAVWNELAPLTPGIAERWSDLSESAPSLGELDRIRAARGPAVARFVSLQAELARRHHGRLDGALLPFLTSKGAEQATASVVARQRAERFASAGPDLLPWDACCGVGSDLLALAERFDRVLATDLDADTLRCAAANLAHAAPRPGSPPGGRSWLAAVGDAGRAPFQEHLAPRILGLFDPDRRPSGARERRAERWSPSLNEVFHAANQLGGACVKLPPSLDESVLSGPTVGQPVALTWTSLDGEMRELSAWTGLLGADAPAREAVSLRSNGQSCSFSGAPEAGPAPTREPTQGLWLVELDPALWRAELAGTFAHQFGATPLEAPGPGGFLVCDRSIEHPMARTWRIAEVVTGDRRRVRAMLRSNQVGPITVKTRHHPETAEALAKRFQGEGTQTGLLAVTRVAGRALAMLLAE